VLCNLNIYEVVYICISACSRGFDDTGALSWLSLLLFAYVGNSVSHGGRHHPFRSLATASVENIELYARYVTDRSLPTYLPYFSRWFYARIRKYIIEL